ncbi:MAG: PD40 domain-containing protein, partial [Chitinivibrionales bacterium]|nr:PD40 domain-containing protein [Chitinivibrionales bacterium]
VYNHGFSLVRYIAQRYGFEKVVAITRESAKFTRLNFDAAIEEVLGISGHELYDAWKESLKKGYNSQIKQLGQQHFGRKINTEGYENYWPRFSPENDKIFFLSNGSSDYPIRSLYSYTLADTGDTSRRITMAIPHVRSFYTIHAPSKQILYSSRKSSKSIMSSPSGGWAARDLFVDKLPNTTNDRKRKLFSRQPKTERQLSERMRYYHGSFSPSGDTVVCSKREADRYSLVLLNKTGTFLKTIYPPTGRPELVIKSIYNLEWSPRGDYIAVSFLDRNDRKIGLYSTVTGEFSLLCDSQFDERDPAFGSDGAVLYFASDRSGIFNIYRYLFETNSLQQLTSVSGGAFTPDVSTDGKKLVFTNYDQSGFAIYLIDSITVLRDSILPLQEGLKLRAGYPVQPHTVSLTPPRPYSHKPRQFLVVPTVIAEQTLSRDNDAFTGVTDAKIGAVVNLLDPLAWKGMGTTLGAFFLIDPRENLFSLKRVINRKAQYDVGLFGSTQLLPITVSASYLQRAITGIDQFDFDGFGDTVTVERLYYNLNPHEVLLSLSHAFNEASSINLVGVYDFTRVWIRTPVTGYDNYWSYVPSKGWHVGAFYSFSTIAPQMKMSISPNGLGFKAEYDFCNKLMQTEMTQFTIKDNQLLVVYAAPYLFHQVSANVLFGMPAPWYGRHDLYTEIAATAVSLTESSKKKLQKDVEAAELSSANIPSFTKPAAWLAGYSYYYKDSLRVIHHKKGSPLPPDTLKLYQDTVLIAGNGVLSSSFSYRFPLVPGTIGKKLWFLYLDKLYGGLNFGAATAVEKMRDISKLAREDFLLSYGTELRLQSLSFGMPLAISWRWDRGIDKKAPIGGDKFTLKLGFNFDNWGIVVEPKRTLQGFIH